MTAIETKQITKNFNGFTAVNDVSLTVNTGEMFALIGPNGAGKTTLIKMLVGLLLPSSGTATVYGTDIRKNQLAAKRHIGYVADDAGAYGYLTGEEFLVLTGRLRGLAGTALQKRISELMPLFPIADILKHPMAEYSRGNKQKVAVLASMLSRPDVLIIDEPIVGLDSRSIDILGKALTGYTQEGHTVFFVTHILSFAKDYATRVAVMDEGKIIKETKNTKSVSLREFLG